MVGAEVFSVDCINGGSILPPSRFYSDIWYVCFKKAKTKNLKI